MNTLRSLAAWLITKLIGPACPVCGERLRGWRTLLDHCELEHPEATPGRTA